MADESAPHSPESVERSLLSALTGPSDEDLVAASPTAPSSLPLSSPRTTPLMGRRAASELRHRIKTNGSLGRTGGSGGTTPTASASLGSTSLAAAAAAALDDDTWGLNFSSGLESPHANSSLGLSDEDLQVEDDDEEEEEEDEEDEVFVLKLKQEEEEDTEEEDEERKSSPEFDLATFVLECDLEASARAAVGVEGLPRMKSESRLEKSGERADSGRGRGQQRAGSAENSPRRRRAKSEGRDVEALLRKRRQLYSLKKQLRYFHQAKRDVLERLMALKQQITDVESREMETMREMELERALLDGEYQSELSAVRVEKDHMLNLRKEHTVQLQILLDDQNENEEDIDLERQKLADLEEQLSAVERRLQEAEETEEADPAAVAELQRQVEATEERVEAQRKLYEDLEFQHLEDQTRFDEEREGMLHELMTVQNGLLDKYKERESRLQALDNQQTSMLADVRKNIDLLEQERHRMLDQFKKEKTKLAIADGRIAELSKQFAAVTLDGNGAVVGEKRAGKLPPLLPLALGGDDEDEFVEIAATEVPKTPTPNPSTVAAIEAVLKPQRPSAFQPGPAFSQRAVSSLTRHSSDVSELRKPAPIAVSATAVREAPHSATPKENGWPFDFESGSGGSSSLGTHSTPSLPGESSAAAPHSSSSASQGLAGAGAVLLRSHAREKSRPLTRYLPVTDPNFNLRRYVESCGHPLDLCRSKVHIAGHTCRGYLWKMGGRIRSWRKRWFCFDRLHKKLVYCSRAPKHHSAAEDGVTASEVSKAKGQIAFADILDVFVDHLHRVKSPHPGLTFCVETSQRLFYLFAPSAEVMRIWVDVLFTGAEGYLLMNASSTSDLAPS